ncbi:BamA/TamA family outer membrane protein [Thermovibrio sp.]
MGYAVEVKGSKVIITDYEVVVGVKFYGLPSELSSIKETVRLLTSGKPLNSVDLSSIKNFLLLKLKTFGYPEPEVSLFFKKGSCGYYLVVKVKSGYRLLIREVKVVSPPPFRALASSLFSSLMGKEVNFIEIRELQDRLLNALVDRGYYNARVSVSVIPLSESSLRFRPALLKVEVNPGRLYKIVFKGNRHFPSKALFKLLTFKSARSVDQFEIENSKERIKEFYENNGFPFVSVKASLIEGDRVGKVIFKISEGPLVVVKRVVVSEYSSKEVKSYLKELLNKPYSKEKVANLVAEIELSLKKRGYLKPLVFTEVSKGGLLKLSVRKGALYLVSGFKVVGDKLKCFKGLKLPKPLTEDLISQLEDSIYNCYADRGYPEVKVSVRKELLSSSDGVRKYRLFVKVSPGRFYRFCFVVVKGLVRTKVPYIKNLIIIEPGAPYSKAKVMKQYSKLLDSRLFSSISLKSVKGKGCYSEVIEVKEGALLSLRGFLGYGTETGCVLNGFASSTSPLGFGVKYFLFGNYRQKEGYDAVFKLLKPAFPFKRYDLSYSIVKKEQIYESFTFDKIYYDFSLNRKASRYLTQTFSFTVSRSRLRNTTISADKRTLERKLTFIQLYDKRNNLSNPTKGYLLKSLFGLSGLLFGGEASYYQLEERFKYLYPLGKEVVALRLGFGAINSLRGKAVPVEDRFFLGGAESVRGYKYGTISPVDSKGNFVGGKAYGLFSVELRFPLKGSVEGALFYDSGKVFPSVKDFSLSGWYSSVGFGLRYLTPVGPLRLDYGYKLKRVPGQGPGRIHISFGFPF